MVEELNSSITSLSVGDKEQLNSLYLDPTSMSIEEAKKVLNKSEIEIPNYLKEKINNEIPNTIKVMKYISSARFIGKYLAEKSKIGYVNGLKNEIKLNGEDKSILNLIHEFITISNSNLEDLEPLISIIIPYIDSSDIVFLIILSIISKFKDTSYAFLQEQLEILTIEEKSIPSFKIVSLIFSIDSKFGSKLFKLATFQNLLIKINNNTNLNSEKIIKSALNLLSSACVESELRTFIIENYLDTLIFALKFTKSSSIQSLSALVILKTWNFETLAVKDVKINDLCDIFIKDLNSDSIEGLSYLSLKESVKTRLRNDDTFLFDIFNNLKEPKDTYGILSILSNLSSIEEKNEFTDLKKQAKKNLDEKIEENIEEIEEFRGELIERRIIESMIKLKQTKNIVDKSLNLLYNICQIKKLNAEIVKQGGFHLLMSLLNEVNSIESRNMGLKALTLLIINSNPNLIFNKDSPKTAFNYIFNIFVDEESFKEKDQYLALIALTNLALLESIGSLSVKQWEIIDSFLLNDNIFLRRSSIELISNLMQQKINLVALFNFENNLSKKRFQVIVRYTQLDDVKSQSAALTALTFGITIPFICENIVKNSPITEYCIEIIKTQIGNTDLIERCLFILYYIVFNNEKIAEELQKNIQLRDNLQKIMKSTKYDSETIELAIEIHQLIN